MFFAQSSDLYYTTTTTNIDSTTGAAIFGFGMFTLFLFALIPYILVVIAWWKIFVKAGQPGWAAIIPIYNMYILLKIIGRPTWWLWLLILLVIPFVNFIGAIVWFILGILIAIDLGKAFGKDTVYSILLLWLFSIIGYLLLGFGSDKYLGAPTHPTQPSQPAAPTPAQ